MGHEDVVQLLLKKGANVNAKNFAHRTTPLIRASFCSHTKIVEYLLDAGARVNNSISTRWRGSRTALEAAARAGYSDIVRMLFLRGAKAGERALTEASGNGDMEAVTLRLEKGIDPNTPGLGDKVALIEGCMSTNKKMVSLLLSKGAHITVSSINSPCTVWEANTEFTKEDKEVTHFLCSYFIETVVENQENPWALVRVPSQQIAQCLSAAGRLGDPKMVGSLLRTAMEAKSFELWMASLQEASFHGCYDIVLSLLDGADLGTPEQLSFTATGRMSVGTSLLIASGKGFTNIVRLLLRRGVDPNSTIHPEIFMLDRRCNFETALQDASAEGHSEVVKVLLEHGASVNCNTPGNLFSLAAIDIALDRGHDDVVYLFIKHAVDLELSASSY